ncbi:MAG: DUF2804 domain-containing protein [Thermoleophilaceae bacterium]
MALPARGDAVRRLALPIPPARMPRFQGLRPLKRWRYVGVYGPELELCVGDARIGPAPVRWWAIARPGEPLREGRRGIELAPGTVRVRDGGIEITIDVDERAPVETATAYGRTFAWTAKQADVPARGVVRLEGRELEVDARAVVDESAGYHPRHTAWKWSAGVGTLADGVGFGWNLVTGIHDSPQASERTIWLDGEAVEVEPVVFEDDLTGIRFTDGNQLRFREWSARTDRTNLLLMRSYYRQPFGTFEGSLPGGVAVAEAYGVMEDHEVWW